MSDLPLISVTKDVKLTIHLTSFRRLPFIAERKKIIVSLINLWEFQRCFRHNILCVVLQASKKLLEVT